MKSAISEIEKLVGMVAEKAIEEDTALGEKIEALKVLGPYYTLLKKAQANSDDDSPDETTMGGLQDELRRVEQENSNGRAVSRRSDRRRN